MTVSRIKFLIVENSSAASFAKWMSARRGELKITLDELEVRTGIKKQHLSVLERASPHSLTGKPVVPKRGTVEKIAKGLGSNLTDALTAAGYATPGAINQTYDIPGVGQIAFEKGLSRDAIENLKRHIEVAAAVEQARAMIEAEETEKQDS